VTREDIAKNPPSAYQILSDPELGGHRSVNGPHTRYTDLRVPAANLLTTQGAAIVERTFGMSAALVGAMCVGVMRHAFDAALAFCKTEARGGNVSIIRHQSVSDRLMDAKMRIEAARALTWKAMGALDSKEESLTWEQRLEIALEAKIWCSEQVLGVVEMCMSVVGM
jgi:alkylation response protein AidB-like acyl-CoA dehydrogenase